MKGHSCCREVTEAIAAAVDEIRHSNRQLLQQLADELADALEANAEPDPPPWKRRQKPKRRRRRHLSSVGDAR